MAVGGCFRLVARDVSDYSGSHLSASLGVTVEDILIISNHHQGTYARSLLSTLNLSAIHCVQVPHRGYATALVLDHASGWRLVYSGDTKPSDKLARLGKDATVLIHEATIVDGLEATAEMKGHSTFGQAIDIGKR